MPPIAAALSAGRGDNGGSRGSGGVGVPIPPLLALPRGDGGGTPSALLQQLYTQISEGGGVKAVSFEHARRIARKMREPTYSLRHFHDDVTTTFPELRYYLLASTRGAVHGEESKLPSKRRTSLFHFKSRRKQATGAASGGSSTTSGIGAEAEYLRTIGALFALYWLARIDIDGARGFTFGVDEATWQPLERREPQTSSFQARPLNAHSTPQQKAASARPDDPQAFFFSQTVSERRETFYREHEWPRMTELMANAGLLTRHKEAAGTLGEWSVDEERMAGMLALTAVHDIMKMAPLLPTVQRQHAPYEGFGEGVCINDHDVALGYVLSHYGDALPSYAMLPEALQHTIRFCTVKMGFNHGWLVQAEAPPGPLFAKFRAAITSDPKLSKSDVAFYFVHWLTDLGGAEPSPLLGSEKLVVRFPHSVLRSFVASFSIVGELAVESETRIFETYLRSRWKELEQQLGAPPLGEEGVAMMRLVIQAQSLPLQRSIVEAWVRLDEDDRKVLAFEMALTGIAEQQFAELQGRDEFVSGPAFLVYYSPTFLRNAARTDALSGLQMLAEVYRQARSLWPGSRSQAGEAVTVRIDQIKELPPQTIMDAHAFGDAWMLEKQNRFEGVIKQQPVYSILGYGEDTELASKRLLAFWWRTDDELDDNIGTLESLRAKLVFSASEGDLVGRLVSRGASPGAPGAAAAASSSGGNRKVQLV
uniref:Uncharacterized protein n=1 Tax=Haptolina brevifila TaxID=156173 RepID=A0A7S2N7H0_9EUKA